MKNLLLSALLGLILFGSNLLAQTQSVTYQGIAINAAGQRLANQTISLQLSVLNGSSTGAAVYVETQTITTNVSGAFTVQVGLGTAVSGSFASINWMANAHFIKVELDPLAGTDYIITYNGTITESAIIHHLTLASVTTTPITNTAQFSASSGGNVTSDGWSTITARGVCWSTTANPTITNNHTSDGTGTGTFASNIAGLSPGILYHIRAYATNSMGTAYGNDLSLTTLAWICGTSTLTVNHFVGEVAPVSKTVTYSTVTNIPGTATKCWITSNLGADHQAITVSDAGEPSAGWYWQFNLKQGHKNDGSTITPSWTITSISESSNWLSANDPCTSELGSGWRLPTSTEWTNVDATGNWTDWTGPWNSGLKLHAAGYLNSNSGAVGNRGSTGNYWSSSQNNSSLGWDLNFNNGNSLINSNNKANGYSVRCIKD